MKKNEKGFTLVELLAVIVILGLLMAIEIPSVTKYITQSRIKTLVSTMDSYVTAVVTQVNDGEYKFSDSSKVFAIPIECVSLEKGGTDPFGNWMQANSAYWAYVLVHYDSENYNYEYGFTFKDDAGYGLYPTRIDSITSSMVKTGYDELVKPKNGLALKFVDVDEWEGFSNITSTTELVVLEATLEGETGDGINTCTLCQKGDNYDQVNYEISDKDKADKELPILSSYSSTKFWVYKEQIKTITFEDRINVPNDAFKSWDVSSTGNGMVMAYIIPNKTDSSYYDLYIQGEGRIYANPNSSSLFYNFTNVDSINNIEVLNTSRVTNMNNMFYSTGYNSTVFTLDLGNKFNTSNVTNMSAMFSNVGYNSPVFTLDLGNKFDTSNVTDMFGMFNHAGYSSKVMTLDLGDKFNTSNVTKMSRMFLETGHSSTVFTLYLGDKFDTSGVSDLSHMFCRTGYSSTIFTLDLGDKFNTSNVTNMQQMFQDTGFKSSVFTLDLGGKFDTSNVTNMTYMFLSTGYSSSLFKLNCSSWNVQKVTEYEGFNASVTSKVIAPVWVN